jgi:cytochrome b involved in lipid metabolism
MVRAPMRLDACLELVEASRHRRPASPLQKLMKGPLGRLRVYAPTPHERIVEAVRMELHELIGRAEDALHRAVADESTAPALETARGYLSRGKREGAFPRGELEKMSRAGTDGAPAEVRSLLAPWVERHHRLERRLRWLLDPRVTGDELESLDARHDADQIWCHVWFCFLPEILYGLWGNAIKRIAQLEAAATFFHSTGKAEGIPLRRNEDTALFYAYVFNWGLDSYHGKKAISGMNRIHGRYFIHNDGMKYVLLNAAFTVLDGLDVIGHRPLTETERLGYFHAQIDMGQAMNIQHLSHHWDEMYAWFVHVSRRFSGYTPQKARVWNAIEDGFDRDVGVSRLAGKLRRLPELVAMDDAYRSALGFERSSPIEIGFCRTAMKAMAKSRAMLPREPYIQSLHAYLSYPDGAKVEEVGEKQRSEHMPAVCPFSGQKVDNKGYPGDQRPLLDVRHAARIELATVSWAEVKKHDKPDDLWLVWGGHVYDLSAFAKNHPGTLQVLLDGVGKDMTGAFEMANHSDLTRVFSLNFRIAKIEATRHTTTEAQVAATP